MSKPTDTSNVNTKMLQILIDGQTNMRNEMSKIRQEMKEGFEKTNARIDSLGEEIASVDDDAPTGEDFYKLKRRVRRLEVKFAN